MVEIGVEAKIELKAGRVRLIYVDRKVKSGRTMEVRVRWKALEVTSLNLGWWKTSTFNGRSIRCLGE